MLGQLTATLAAALFVSVAAAQLPSAPATGSSAPTQTQKNIEAYLRNLYAFGSDVSVIVGPLKEYAVESHGKRSPPGALTQVNSKASTSRRRCIEVEAIRPQRAGFGELHRRDVSSHIPLRGG